MGPKRKAKAPAAAPPAAAAADQAGPSQQPASKRRRATKEAERRPGADCFCFGTGAFGQLGLGEEETVRYRPTDAVDLGGHKAVEVACGGMHTVALTNASSVYTWGVNDEGALGRPTEGTAWEGSKELKEDHTVPGLARLPAGVHIVQVVAGDGFTFALADDGVVWGWGCFKDESGGTEGFPGLPTKQKRACLPIKVIEPEGARDRVTKIAAGSRHMAALNRRGEVLTWGFGAQGQLGRLPKYEAHESPPLQQLLVPQVVPGVGSSNVVDIACGSYTTFAMVGRTGDVVAWGLNNAGQLGIPKSEHQPQQQDGQQQQQQQQNGVGQAQQPGADGQPQQPQEEQCVWAPMMVDALEHVAAIAGGERHSLALTKQGHVLSFGEPTYGMLGRGAEDTDAANVILPPGRVADGNEEGLGDDVAMVAAGPDVSAAVKKDGAAFFWGSNVSYQLAKGQDEEDCTEPAKMKRTAKFGRRSVVAVSFGGQHAALLALPAQVDAVPAAAVPVVVPAGAPGPAAAAAQAAAAVPAAAAPEGAAAAPAGAAGPAQEDAEAPAAAASEAAAAAQMAAVVPGAGVPAVAAAADMAAAVAPAAAAAAVPAAALPTHSVAAAAPAAGVVPAAATAAAAEAAAAAEVAAAEAEASIEAVEEVAEAAEAAEVDHAAGAAADMEGVEGPGPAAGPAADFQAAALSKAITKLKANKGIKEMIREV